MQASNEGRVLFTKEMRKDYTILFPCMLPMHFKIISNIFNAYGYKTKMLEHAGKPIVDAGLKYVHNDACYPALLVIGQFITAIESGEYDPHKTALLITQTGGGCRASNYIALLRKALERAGYGYIPVVSLSVGGLEKNPGFKLTPPLVRRLLYAVTYGDLLMCLLNQCRPYEINEGESARLADEWTKRLADEMMAGRVRYGDIKENYRKIVRSFAEIPRRKENKPRVGIVGEIYVKFSPIGNNNLEDLLIAEGAETVMPGLMNFLLYCVYNGELDYMLYGMKPVKAKLSKIGCDYLIGKQRDLINAVKEEGSFRPPSSFAHTRTLPQGFMGMGAKMGEGWLLTAEMLELIEDGVPNIVCAQPFGCLPNHIVGKGVMKRIKEERPGANIVAIDYDPGATRINQENRIKLMLSNAKMTHEADRSPAAEGIPEAENRLIAAES